MVRNILSWTIWALVVLGLAAAVFALSTVVSLATPGVWMLPAICLLFGILIGWFPPLNSPGNRIGATTFFFGIFAAQWITVVQFVEHFDRNKAKIVFVLQSVEIGIGLAISCLAALHLVFFGKLSTRQRAYFAALCLFGWLVARFSGPPGGPTSQIQWLMDFFHLTPDQAEGIVTAIRKCFHFLFYGSLGGLALACAGAMGATRDVAIRLGVAFPLMFALFDERMQALTPGRTGSIFDVMLDMSGVATFLMIAEFRRRRNQTFSNSSSG